MVNEVSLGAAVWLVWEVVRVGLYVATWVVLGAAVGLVWEVVGVGLGVVTRVLLGAAVGLMLKVVGDVDVKKSEEAYKEPLFPTVVDGPKPVTVKSLWRSTGTVSVVNLPVMVSSPIILQ